MVMTGRAYSVFQLKAVEESGDTLTITGLATTPTPDRMGDIVKPEGAKFNLPLPLLWQHNSDQPIGSVVKAKVTKSGIEIVATITKGILDEIDRAATLITSRLVRGLSIGFRGLDTEQIPNSWGIIFNAWEWLELSAVTIPANEEATITSVKKFDVGAPPVASGHSLRSAVVFPGVTGKSTNPDRPKEGKMNISERIAALEAERKEKAVELDTIQKKAMEEGRRKDKDERERFNELRDEIKELDAELEDLRDMEELTVKKSAKTVNGDDEDRGSRSRGREEVPQRRTVPAAAQKKVDPGIRFAQLAKIKAVSRMDIVPQVLVAEKMYGRDSEIFHVVKANEVTPGTNASGNWAADLVSSEGAIAADFAEYLRPATIIGKFGQNGIPALRNVPFRRPLVIQTGAGAGYWVGEGKPKPLTSFDFDRSTLDPLKCATIAVLSMENIRDSSPSSDAIVRDELRRVLVQLQDAAFIDPTNAGTSNVKPASVLNGADAIAASSYTDENDVILDVRSLLQKFINANNPASQAVLIMQEGTGLSLGLILNALGQRAFPGVGMRGGALLDIPVITSESVTSGDVGIVNASDIFIGDDGDVTVDMSTEASLEMKSATLSQDGTAGTGASLVSLWQNNLVGLRAEKTVNWKRRRTTAAAYLTGVAWGGAVNVS